MFPIYFVWHPIVLIIAYANWYMISLMYAPSFWLHKVSFTLSEDYYLTKYRLMSLPIMSKMGFVKESHQLIIDAFSTPWRFLPLQFSFLVEFSLAANQHLLVNGTTLKQTGNHLCVLDTYTIPWKPDSFGLRVFIHKQTVGLTKTPLKVLGWWENSVY